MGLITIDLASMAKWDLALVLALGWLTKNKNEEKRLSTSGM